MMVIMSMMYSVNRQVGHDFKIVADIKKLVEIIDKEINAEHY